MVRRRSNPAIFLGFFLLKLSRPDDEQNDESREKGEKLQLGEKLRPIIEVAMAGAEDAAEHKSCVNRGRQKCREQCVEANTSHRYAVPYLRLRPVYSLGMMQAHAGDS